MTPRKTVLPRLESLETKTVMSAGALIAPTALVRLEPGPIKPSLPFHDNAADPPSTKAQKIDLDGQANGFYTSRGGPPDTGTRFQVNVSGTIAPVGAAYVSGSYHNLEATNGAMAPATLTRTRSW